MNNLPTPLNRVELYLATAAQMPGVTPPEEPLSRLEQYLAFIAGDTSVELPAPASLCEQWLAYVAGITPAEPLKLEGAFHVGVQKVDVRFFAVAAGMPGVVAPEPQNRTEQYWARLAEILPVHGVLKYATGANITLTDVAWWKMGIERINGDTTQQTYTGKNLLYLESGLSSGVAGTVNQDGTITISGKATATGGYPVFADETRSWSAGTYTATISKELPFVINYTLSTGVNFRFPAGTTSVTITLSEDYESLCHFYAAITSGETYDETFSMQIVSGETPDYNFEPYVGGVSAPNPNYPQAINTVTGEQTVEIRGKNLVYVPNGSQTRNNTTLTTDNGTLTLKNSGAVSSTCFGVDNTLRQANWYNAVDWGGTTLPAGTYTLSFHKLSGSITGGTGDSIRAQVVTRPVGSTSKPGSVAVSIRMTGGDTNGTFTLADDVEANIVVYMYGNNFDVDLVFNLQLEQGSTATDFQPYQKTEYKINLTGKNLFNKANALTYKWLNLNTGKVSNSSDPNVVTPYIEVEVGEQYTFSGIDGLSIRVFGYANPNDNKLVTYIDNVKNKRTFTAQYPYMRASIGGGDAAAVIDNIQIEQGGTATTFEPYNSIELCKIGTYQDYVCKNGKDWYIHKEIRHLSLPVVNMDNTDNFPGWKNTQEIAQDFPAGYNQNINYATSSIDNIEGLNLLNSGSLIWGANATTNILYANRSFFGLSWTQTYWKTNYNDLYVELYYGIVNPITDTKITNQALISQLNALDRAILPQPIAYITASGDLPGELKISYYGEEE